MNARRPFTVPALWLALSLPGLNAMALPPVGEAPSAPASPLEAGAVQLAAASAAPAAASQRLKTPYNPAAGESREQLQALAGLLDRYGSLRSAAPSAADWRALAERFDALAESADGTLVAKRARLMAADATAWAGDANDAVRRFEEAKDQHPLVADWVLWRLAGLEPSRANERLRELVERFPDSPLLAPAKVALAERESDPAKKRAALKAVVREHPTHPAAERALYRLAQLPGAGQAAALVAYWDACPDGPALDEVVHTLAKLPGLSADTRYRLGSYFYFQSDYGPAIRAFDTVRSPMALYRMARSYWGLNDLPRAVATLKQVINKDSSLAGKAFLTLGQVEAQRGQIPQAIAAYQSAARYGGEAGVTARWKLAKLYRDRKSEASARQLEQTIMRDFPWSEEATSILWQAFWSAYQSGRTNDALVNGQRLAQHHPSHPMGQAAQYWMGRLYERQGQSAKARSTYQALVGRAPSSYYGWRAHFRERELSGAGKDPWFSTQPGRQVTELPIRWHDLLHPAERALVNGTAAASGKSLPREMLDWSESVRELVYLRQFDVAEAVASGSKSPNLKAWISFLQLRYRQAIREEKGEPQLAYPLGFAPLLTGAAGRHGVDPLLLAALVREESRFDPMAKSWVGATGLAQLMPFTADWVVKQVPDVAGKPLTDPNTNLQLGAWYLAHTHQVFDGASMYAVAAYNGGPGAVGKWKRNFNGDPDAFVETIPYPETQEYVRKVFSSYWNYIHLYSER